MSQRIGYHPVPDASIQVFTQIIDIAVKKTFLLNEIAEHQSVEHNRSIPLLITVLFDCYIVIDTGYELGKGCVFLLEPRIEVLGDFFSVYSESTMYTLLYINNGCGFRRVKSDAIEL